MIQIVTALCHIGQRFHWQTLQPPPISCYSVLAAQVHHGWIQMMPLLNLVAPGICY
jgi:hypothetical protein